MSDVAFMNDVIEEMRKTNRLLAVLCDHLGVDPTDKQRALYPEPQQKPRSSYVRPDIEMGTD